MKLSFHQKFILFFPLVFRSIIFLDIACLIPSPPPQVSTLHKQIIEKLKNDLVSQGINLIEGDSGPAIVVAVNNSRIAADVKRDVARAGSLDFPCTLCNDSYHCRDS